MVSVFNSWSYVAQTYNDLHYGVDLHPYNYNPFQGGVFIKDAKVYANISGVVVFSGRHNSGANCVVIKDNECLLHYYVHLSIIKVFNNKIITLKDEIGTVGNTGKSSGIHLHYEIKNKRHERGKINPCDYCGIENIYGAAFPPKGW